jgi:hypothetical protein
MIFGNRFNVAAIAAAIEQHEVHAMRTTRAITLGEVARKTGLPPDEIKRYNPALTRRVPAHATLYLPRRVAAFGRDVAFWRRPAPAAFQAVRREFEGIDVTPAEWDEPSFQPVLQDFARRFAATKTEEGIVMATVIAYVARDAASSGRREILDTFRASTVIRAMFDHAVRDYTLARTSRDDPAITSQPLVALATAAADANP